MDWAKGMQRVDGLVLPDESSCQSYQVESCIIKQNHRIQMIRDYDHTPSQQDDDKRALLTKRGPVRDSSRSPDIKVTRQVSWLATRGRMTTMEHLPASLDDWRSDVKQRVLQSA